VENSGSESENEPAMTVPRGKEEATAARCRLCGKKSRKTTNIFAPGGLSGLIEDCLRLKVRQSFSSPPSYYLNQILISGRRRRWLAWSGVR